MTPQKLLWNVKGEEKCNHFSFDEDSKDSKRCVLYQEIDAVYQKRNGKFIVTGPKVCPSDSNVCTAFE